VESEYNVGGKRAIVQFDNDGKECNMKYIVFLLISVFILGCKQKQGESILEKKEISLNKENKKIKSIISTSYLTEVFSPDSSVFEEKIIKYFDTVGQLVEIKQYIIDSTILYRHQFQEYQGDTLFKIEKNIRNVFKPNTLTDTLKFADDLIVESIKTTNFRYTNISGKDIETPISTKIVYEYDEEKRLARTTQYHDGTICQCNYSYNENNLLVEKECKWANSPNRLYMETLFYNDKGLAIDKRETTFENDSIIGCYQRLYKYNEQDSLSYQSWYHDGKNFLIYDYEFNEKGQKISEYIYNDSSGDSTRLIEQTLYHYNEKDNLTMVSCLAINKDPIYTIYYFYDDNNNVIEERRVSHTIDIDRRSYETRKVTRHYYEYW
jgi:hypothetical protein